MAEPVFEKFRKNLLMELFTNFSELRTVYLLCSATFRLMPLLILILCRMFEENGTFINLLEIFFESMLAKGMLALQ